MKAGDFWHQVEGFCPFQELTATEEVHCPCSWREARWTLKQWTWPTWSYTMQELLEEMVNHYNRWLTPCCKQQRHTSADLRYQLERFAACWRPGSGIRQRDCWRWFNPLTTIPCSSSMWCINDTARWNMDSIKNIYRALKAVVKSTGARVVFHSIMLVRGKGVRRALTGHINIWQLVTVLQVLWPWYLAYRSATAWETLDPSHYMAQRHFYQ